jgi:hypothetical protein
MLGDKEAILPLLQDYTGTFVEVGTWNGDFATALLEKTYCQRLVCVDPYKFFEDWSYRDSINSRLEIESEQRFLAAQQRLQKIGGDRVRMLRKTSMEAVQDFPNESLDFIYIDGNHEYKYVMEDILAWFPKLRHGGMIAGDDVLSTRLEDYSQNKNMHLRFASQEFPWGVFGVYPALCEVEQILGIRFTVCGTQFYYKKME